MRSAAPRDAVTEHGSLQQLRSERDRTVLRPMHMRLLAALLLPVLTTACAVASQDDTSLSSTQPQAAATPLITGGMRAEPGQSVVLHHCGVVNISYEGQEWEVEDDPFDATNAPGTFSGYGSFTREGEALLFTDDKGATLSFTPWDGETDPFTCA